MSTESVFSARDAVSWHLDGVKFKNSGAEPMDPWGGGGGGGGTLQPPGPALKGNDNPIFNKEMAPQYFPGETLPCDQPWGWWMVQCIHARWGDLWRISYLSLQITKKLHMVLQYESKMISLKTSVRTFKTLLYKDWCNRYKEATAKGNFTQKINILSFGTPYWYFGKSKLVSTMLMMRGKLSSRSMMHMLMR